MHADPVIRSLAVVQGWGELAEQGRRWECCDEQCVTQSVHGVVGMWERAGRATLLAGVIAAPTTSEGRGGSGEPQAKRTQSCAATK